MDYMEASRDVFHDEARQRIQRASRFARYWHQIISRFRLARFMTDRGPPHQAPVQAPIPPLPVARAGSHKAGAANWTTGQSALDPSG
jgi:hypothetical protein